MLSAQELDLLYTLARDRYTGCGDIVDGGAFLGGSTLALGCGLRDNRVVDDKRGRIHSYDLFRADKYVNQFLPGYPEGTSTRPYYDQAIAEVADQVTVHEGDITTSPWPADRPIEIFFIDVAKSWEINDFLLDQFFPNLIPGVSTVIQQDYHWPHTPWLSITMALLADHVTYLGSMPWATAYYRWDRAIAPGELPARLRDLGADRLRDLAGRAHTFERGGREWTAQQCNIVSLCLSLGQVDDAEALFDEAAAIAPTWIDHFKYAPTFPARV
jgi:hypothetical protein